VPDDDTPQSFPVVPFDTNPGADPAFAAQVEALMVKTRADSEREEAVRREGERRLVALEQRAAAMEELVRRADLSAGWSAATTCVVVGSGVIVVGGTAMLIAKALSKPRRREPAKAGRKRHVSRK